MAQVAGFVTQYRNLRQVTAGDSEIDATWSEISYYKPGGRIERTAGVLGRGLALRPLVELRSALKGKRFDALYVNTSAADIYPTPFLRTPSLFDFDSTPIQLQLMPEYGRRRGARPIAYVRWRLKQRLWTNVALLQAWSNWAKDSAVNDYGVAEERVVVNPPGVDLSLWRPAPAEARTGKDDPRRVLFVGADFNRKGGDLLLRWFRSTRPKGVELHIVTRDSIDAGEGVVVHYGLQPNSNELVELYQQSHVFVLPSRAECFGIATIEAMAAGLPVVVTTIGGTRDIVDHERNGYLVRPGALGEMGEALEAVLESDTRRDAMAVCSRAIAEERFDLERNARKTLGMLKALADGRVVEEACTVER